MNYTMKQIFEIYPALFMITPRRENKFSGFYQDRKNEEHKLYKETDNGFNLSLPHVHYGNCMVNPAHTLVTLNLSNVIGAAPEFELPDALLGKLKTENFQGKQYIITYVPIVN